MLKSARSPSLLYVFMFVIGIANMALSVLMPHLAPQTSNGDIYAGRLLAMQFLGSLAGALLVTRRTARSLTAGLLLCLVFAAAIGLSHGMLEPLLLGYGLGLGMVSTAANILTGVEAPPEQRASRMEMLNFFWPLGAAICPWLLAGHPARTALRPYLAISMAMLFLLVCAQMRNGWHEDEGPPPEQTRATEPLGGLVGCCVLALLSVGVEASLGGWIASFAVRYTESSRVAALAASLFWAGILSGRFAASFAMRRVSPLRFATGTSLLAALAAIILSRSQTDAALCVAAFVCALAVSPLYPIVLERAVDLPGKNLVFFTAGTGSALLPWLVGRTSALTGSLRSAMAVPALAALLLAGAFALTSSGMQRRVSREAGR